MRKECEELLVELEAYVEGEPMAASFEERFKTHIAECPTCMDAVLSMCDVQQLDESLATPPSWDSDKVWNAIRSAYGGTSGPTARRKIVRWSLVTISAAAACVLLGVFLLPHAPTAVNLKLASLQEPNRSAIPFPDEQSAFLHDSIVGLDTQTGEGKYRYVLFFDDAGTVEILDEAAMKEADWHWNLTGSRMDTAILIVTAKPLHDTESIENRVATNVRDTSLDPGLRIAWHPAGPQVEVVKMMGTQPPAEVPAWADKVDSVLRTIPGATYHGWSLPVRGPEP